MTNSNAGSDLLKDQLNNIRQSSGSIMRSDHTYKIAKSLSVYSFIDKKMIPLQCSMLVLMNEKSEVMGYKLCPSDEVM